MLINLPALLNALALAETGAHPLAIRHEPAYCYGGFYHTSPNGGDLRAASKQWGCLAHCSFSPWQIMYIVAVEMGYEGDPINLRDPEIARPFVMKMIQKRILDRYPRITLTGVIDAWNTGRPGDNKLPDPTYVSRIVDEYNRIAPKEMEA